MEGCGEVTSAAGHPSLWMDKLDNVTQLDHIPAALPVVGAAIQMRIVAALLVLIIGRAQQVHDADFEATSELSFRIIHRFEFR